MRSARSSRKSGAKRSTSGVKALAVTDPLSQTPGGRRSYNVNALGKVIDATAIDDAFDFETFFYVHYERIARVIVRVARDPARAEEIAVEVFWNVWRNPNARQGDRAGGWLYRTAVRRSSTSCASRLAGLAMRAGTQTGKLLRRRRKPMQPLRSAIGSGWYLHRSIARQAELLLLRSNDLSYGEVAAALDLNPSSVGTLVSRAQAAFRNEYVKQYGEP
jgi:RNA polymerase sigma-70 factor (ECF subfamily)